MDANSLSFVIMQQRIVNTSKLTSSRDSTISLFAKVAML